MADQPTGGKSAAKARWIIIAAIGALGIYLYMRYRKQQAAAAAPQNAAAAGDTNTSATSSSNGQPTVPVLNSLSGTYDGPYTPYNIINNGVQAPAGAMPGGVTTTSQTAALTVNNSNTA